MSWKEHPTSKILTNIPGKAELETQGCFGLESQLRPVMVKLKEKEMDKRNITAQTNIF